MKKEYENVRRSNLEYIRASLSDYIDFDFADYLSAPRQKQDGRKYSTYIAEIQPSYAELAPEKRTVVLKELFPEQAPIYEKLSREWSPYLEAIYGIAAVGDILLSFNEFIEKPCCLDYPTRELREKRSLSLEDYISSFGRLTEKEALIFIVELCCGLETMASLHIVHGDIAPQNILLTDRQACCPCEFNHIKGLHRQISMKIIDFDISKAEKDAEHLVTTVVGTNPFAAPEILDYRSPTDRVDIYSIGCLLSYMITGSSPKQEKKENLDRQYSKEVRKIIEKCTSDYSRRYKNVSEVRRDAEQLLSETPPTLMERYGIPGFRSGRPLLMTFSALAYFAALNVLFFLFLQAATGYDLRAWILILAILSGYILFFDVFHLDRLSKQYQDLRERYPWIRFLIRFLLGIGLPVLILMVFFIS